MSTKKFVKKEVFSKNPPQSPNTGFLTQVFRSPANAQEPLLWAAIKRKTIWADAPN
jgi:hypothetical protein